MTLTQYLTQYLAIALMACLTVAPLVVLWVLRGSDEGDEVRWGWRRKK